MENDFLIKIDALEDQIHNLLSEIDAKDKYLSDLGHNPNEAARSGSDFKRRNSYARR